MQVGDLVRYGHSSQNGIGIVAYVSHFVKDGKELAVDQNCEVIWADGTRSNHSSRWLIRIEEIKCK